MSGKWNCKCEAEKYVMLAAWLVFAWPGLASAVGEIAAEENMTPADSAQTSSVKNVPEDISPDYNRKKDRTEGTAPKPDDDSSFSLKSAPVRFWGNIGYEQRRETINSREYMMQTLSTKINASTFIWQPWFAQVSGGVGISNSTTDTTESKSESAFNTGNASLSLLPASRFPFEMHFDKSDNRLDTGLNSVDPSYRTTRYGLSQRYRTLAGNTQYMLNYDRNIWESALFNLDQQDLLHLEVTHNQDRHTFQLNSDITNNERQQTNESSSINTFVVRHSYIPDATLSVENMGNLSRTNYRLAQGESDFRYQQLSSSAFWHPAEQPLTVSGSVRLYGLNSGPYSNSAPPAEIRNASANLGAFYELSKNTRLNSSINVSKNETNGVPADASNQSAGISYQSDEINLDPFRYNGFGSVTASNRSNPTDSGQHYSLQLGHSVNRNSSLGAGNMGTNLSQAVSSDADSVMPYMMRLTHSGSITWSHYEGPSNTYLRLSASDSRVLDGSEDFFQLVNLQASQNESLSRNSSLAGNLTIQAIRQQTSIAQITSPNIPNMPVTTYSTSSADLSYRHQRAFGVPRLIFVSELRIYGDMPLPVLTVGPQQQDSRSWENRLDYSIGRLQLRVSARISEIRYSNTTQSLLMFNLNRPFGDIY